MLEAQKERGFVGVVRVYEQGGTNMRMVGTRFLAMTALLGGLLFLYSLAPLLAAWLPKPLAF